MQEDNYTEQQREILAALETEPETFESPESLPPEDSPLNEPVIEREFADAPPQPKDAPPVVDSKQATLMADSLLGAADNLMEVGGGYFIKVKKTPDMLEFEELVQVVDEHNQRNILKLKLTDEDKAMLRPLLAEVLRKRARGLTVEEQLLIATCSILIKKAQVVFQIREENKILLARIAEIIREAGEEEESDSEENSEEVSGPVLVEEEMQEEETDED